MSWIRENDVPMSNVIKVMSILPSAMETVGVLNQAITFESSALTRVQEEAIATTVSVYNHCRF